MEEVINQIKNKVEKLLNEKTPRIESFEVTNNFVYKIAGEKSYIFKIYKQRNWPEDGKLLFINHMLIANDIDCAKLVTFDRNDPYFQNGFLIEECLPGISAEHVVFDLESGTEFYKKLALLVSKIHQIPIENYGYIGSGVADYTSFIDFMNDKYNEIMNSLSDKKLFDKKGLLDIKKAVMDKLRQCEHLPSVLNHGDLSTKNVIIDEQGNLALIDWDDAMSYNGIADVARLTYWMKLKYSDQQYQIYRNTFVEHYIAHDSAVSAYRNFDDIENAFHVWIGLDHLDFYSNTPKYEDAMTYFRETVKRL